LKEREREKEIGSVESAPARVFIVNARNKNKEKTERSIFPSPLEEEEEEEELERERDARSLLLQKKKHAPIPLFCAADAILVRLLLTSALSANVKALRLNMILSFLVQ
jgi:hypothetical protein